MSQVPMFPSGGLFAPRALASASGVCSATIWRVLQAAWVLLILAPAWFVRDTVAQQEAEAKENPPVDWYARLEKENGEQQREAYEAILAAPVVDEAALAAILTRQARDVTNRKAVVDVAEICGQRGLAGTAPALVKMACFTRIPPPFGGRGVVFNMWEHIPRLGYPAVGALIDIGAPAIPAIIDGLRESCHLSRKEEKFMPPWHCAYVMSEICGEDAAIRKMQEIHATVSDPTEVEAINECIAYLQQFLRERQQNEADTLGAGGETGEVSPIRQGDLEHGTLDQGGAPHSPEIAPPAPSENPFSTSPCGGDATTPHPGMTARPAPRDSPAAARPTATPPAARSARGFVHRVAFLAPGVLLATLLVFIIWFARRRGRGRSGRSPPPSSSTSPPPAPSSPPSPPPRLHDSGVS
ncbi:MAG: hypothetical protein HY719_02710 [Planctomycetes bacterium]|nr:hypothetical protein [Planctomycetota bacterium]